MKKLITTLSVVALALSLSSVMAAPGNGNGLAVGQDRGEGGLLEITRCSDAGRGNGPEGVGFIPNEKDPILGNPNDLDPGGSPKPNNGQDVVGKPSNGNASPERHHQCPEGEGPA